jgi:hypothetical protein
MQYIFFFSYTLWIMSASWAAEKDQNDFLRNNHHSITHEHFGRRLIFSTPAQKRIIKDNPHEQMSGLFKKDQMKIKDVDALKCSSNSLYQRPIHTGLSNGKWIKTHITPTNDSVHTRVTRSGKIYINPHENTTGIEMIVVPPQYVRREKIAQLASHENAYDLVVEKKYFEDIANKALNRNDVVCQKLVCRGAYTGYLYGCKAGQNPLMIVKQLRSVNERSALEKVVHDPILQQINQKNLITGKAILDPDLPTLTYNAHTFGYVHIDDVDQIESYHSQSTCDKDSMDDSEEIEHIKKSMNYVTILQPAPGKSLVHWLSGYVQNHSSQKFKEIKYIFFKVGKAMAAFHIQTAKLKGDEKADQHLSFKAYQHRDAHWNNIFFDEEKGVSLIDNETLCFSIDGVDTNAIYNPKIADQFSEKPKEIKHNSKYTQYGDWYSLYYTPMVCWKFFKKAPTLCNIVTKAMILGYVSKFDQAYQQSIFTQIKDTIKIMYQLKY